LGVAWGNSNWAASPSATPDSIVDRGTERLYVPFDGGTEGGSWLESVQIGYNYMLPNRWVIGAEADVSFSAFLNYNNMNIGQINSVLNGATSYQDSIFASGTVRGRIGYAPGSWLFYATGGLAWASEQFTLTQNASGASDTSSRQRLGWAAGVGIEAPLMPHWTVRAEYLYTDYGNNSINFPTSALRIGSDLNEQEVRVGMNYRFGDSSSSAAAVAPILPGLNSDNINIHAQITATWQGYPAFKQSPQFIGNPGTLPNGGEGREVGEATAYLGFRLWQGAELWVNPEIDQGFGLNNTFGIADFPTAEAYELGQAIPYAKVQRAFVRQTIDRGGETQRVAADLNQFANTQTADRLVLTVGRFSPLDIFNVNSYASSPRTQFMNWGLNYALPLDWGADAWGFGPGAASGLYLGRFTYRLGWFAMSNQAYSNTSNAYGTSADFSQWDVLGEIEERHELWGQPGKIKVLVNMVSGDLGSYADALALAEATDQPPGTNLVRQRRQKFDGNINIEQQIVPNVGVYTRFGLSPDYVETYATADNHLFFSAGLSVAGAWWGRPNDTVGLGGIYNQASNQELQLLTMGGNGNIVPGGYNFNTGAEKVIEAYYNYQLNSSTSVAFDYQCITNPAFNASRGPVNIFGGRLHWQM
jgi:high affinity Mn2+ porin